MIMVTQNDVEIYLDDCGYPFEAIDEGMWRVESPDNNVDNIILRYADPILFLRVKLAKVPHKNREAFYERLLQLNAGINHGAFALAEDDVILADALEIENLDRNELQASVDSLGFTVAQYYGELKSYLAE
jgi:hypothetical protein